MILGVTIAGAVAAVWPPPNVPEKDIPPFVRIVTDGIAKGNPDALWGWEIAESLDHTDIIVDARTAVSFFPAAIEVTSSSWAATPTSFGIFARMTGQRQGAIRGTNFCR